MNPAELLEGTSPGPWAIERGSGLWQIMDAYRSTTIAILGEIDDEPELCSDAALLAAAPELARRLLELERETWKDVPGRELLLGAGQALKPAREVRYRALEAFADVTGDELEAGIRSLRALSYSCQQGATTLERALRVRCVLCRLHEQESGSDLCEGCLAEADDVAEEFRT